VGGSIDGRDVLIRRVQFSDLKELATLDGAFGDLTYPYFVLRQFFDFNRDCWLVAEHSDRPIGYVLGVPGSDRENAWILGQAVAPEYRRCGYGRSLVQVSLANLRLSGARRAWLTVKPGNLAAIRLYTAVGFTEEGLQENYLGPGEDRILMKLDL
jgi:[ribosomal protein S18]-alanine N-acetyltransferase